MKSVMLIENSEKYRGNFVATRSFKDKKIISHGKNPAKVLKEAKELGADEPVIMFIPKENMTMIY
jgi:hypothetical protein